MNYEFEDISSITQTSNGYVLQILENTLTLNSFEYIQDNDPISAIVNLSDLYQQINTTENNSPQITSPSTYSIDENTSVENLIYDIEVNQNENEEIFYYLSGHDRFFFNIDNNSGKIYFKEIPDFEVKSSYDLVINATSQLLPFENFSNQVDRSTPIDESAFIVERLDGDIGLVIFETNWLSVFYPGGQLVGGDYPYSPYVTVGDAIDSFKSSAYYDEDLGRHVTFQTENLRTPFEDMNKFKVISRSELDVLNGEITNPFDTRSFNDINLIDVNWFDIFPNDLNSELSDTKTLIININDLNEAPTSITLDASSVTENDVGGHIGKHYW